MGKPYTLLHGCNECNKRRLDMKKISIGVGCLALSACTSSAIPTSNQSTSQTEVEVVELSSMVPQNATIFDAVNAKLYALNKNQTVYFAGGIATHTQLQTESLPTINLNGLEPAGVTSEGMEYFDVSYTPTGATQAIDLRVFTTGFSNGSPKTIAASYNVTGSYDGVRVFATGNRDFTDLSGLSGPVIYHGVTEDSANGAVVLQIDNFDTGEGTFTYENNTLALAGITVPGAVPSWTTLKTDVTVDNESGRWFGINPNAVVSSGGSTPPPVRLETYGNIVGNGNEMIGALIASGVSDGAQSFTTLKSYVGKQSIDPK